MKIDWPKFVGVLDDEQMGSLIFLSFLCESHKAVQKLKPIRDWLIRAIPTMHEFKYESVHNDDIAVDTFARAMKEKMAQAREKGRGGWEGCNPADLSRMLSEHVEKGDPCDVANFCMMLWHHSASIAAQPASGQQPVPQVFTDTGDAARGTFGKTVFAEMSNSDDLWPVWLDGWLRASEQQAALGLSDDVHSRLEFYATCYCKSTSATDREAGKAMYALLAAKGDGHADE